MNWFSSAGHGRKQVVTQRHALSFTAEPQHIDALGHVNNAVWVQWIEALATAHWEAAARPVDQAQWAWVVTRHEIDYMGNIGPGESVRGETWIPAPPTGARFDRRVDFATAAGKVIVSARTTWAMIDAASGRLARVRDEITAPFRPFESDT